jgi:hypothetical protein
LFSTSTGRRLTDCGAELLALDVWVAVGFGLAEGCVEAGKDEWVERVAATLELADGAVDALAEARPFG